MKIKVCTGDYGHLFAFKGDRSSRWGDWYHLFSPLHRQAIRVCVTHSQCLLGVPGSRVMFVLSRGNCTNAFLSPCAQTLLQYDRPNHRQKQGPQTIHYKPVHWSFIILIFFYKRTIFLLNGGHRRVHQVGVSTRVLCVQWPCQWHQWSSSRGPQGQKNLF